MILFIYIINNKRPKTDPCTLYSTFNKPDHLLSKLICCTVPLRYDRKHSRATSIIPYWYNFVNNLSLSVVLKAYFKSMNMTSIILLSLTISFHSSTIIWIAVSQEYPFLKSDWCSIIMLLLSKYLSNYFLTTNSNTFSNVGNILMGELTCLFWLIYFRDRFDHKYLLTFRTYSFIQGIVDYVYKFTLYHMPCGLHKVLMSSSVSFFLGSHWLILSIFSIDTVSKYCR